MSNSGSFLVSAEKSDADLKMLLPNNIDIEKIPDYKSVG